MIPPLLLGDSVIMKHSPQTPQCALALQEAFDAAEFDKGEFQNVFATHQQCSRMISDRRIRGVKFTGSTASGKRVAVECAQNIKQTNLELGGNDPLVVLKDADMEKAVDAAFTSRMLNNG